MGIFGKIKQNLQHGGVKIQIQAAASARTSDDFLPVTLNVLATDQPAHINSVRAIIQIARPKDPSTGTGDNSVLIYSQAESQQPFDLQPGQTQTVQLNLPLKSTPDGDGVMGKLNHFARDAAQSAAINNATFYLVAQADVEGIAIDPTAQQNLTLWRFGETGIAKNFNL